jgi:hypothetical protein
MDWPLGRQKPKLEKVNRLGLQRQFALRDSTWVDQPAEHLQAQGMRELRYHREMELEI